MPQNPPTGEYLHLKVKPASEFDDSSFRTIKFGSGGVKAIIGKKDGSDTTEVVTVLFPKGKFSLEEAKDWMKTHRSSLAAKTEAYLILEAAAEAGEEPDSLALAVEFVELAEATQAMALPAATPTKAYAIARLLSFYPVINANRDAFTAESVGESHKTLIGSPVLAEPALSDHGEDRKTGERRSDVAQVGTVVAADLQDNGIDLLIAFQRERLEKMSVGASKLVEEFALSMEATFLKSRAQYKSGEKFYTFEEALATGIASPLGVRDDRSKYEARIISPIEYPAVMLLKKGKNADKTAEFEQVAAVEEVSSIDTKFAEPEKVEMEFVPTKASVQGERMEQLTLTQAEFDAKIADAVKTAIERYEVDELPKRIDTALEKAKPEIEQAAVASFKAQERRVADRLARLHEVLPLKDDERKALEEKVRAAADEGAWKDLLIERLEAARKQPATAAAARDTLPPPTLTGKGKNPAKGAFSVVAE